MDKKEKPEDNKEEDLSEKKGEDKSKDEKEGNNKKKIEESKNKENEDKDVSEDKDKKGIDSENKDLTDIEKNKKKIINKDEEGLRDSENNKETIKKESGDKRIIDSESNVDEDKEGGDKEIIDKSKSNIDDKNIIKNKGDEEKEIKDIGLIDNKDKDLTKKDIEDNKKDSGEKSDKGKDNQEISSEERIKHQNKILRNFLVVIGGIILIIVFIYFVAMMPKTLEYKGVEFNEHKEKELLFYHTTFPKTNSQGDIKNFNVYLRTSPDKLKTIEFNGDFEFKNNMVINFSDNISEEFECNGSKKGDDVIAIANVLNVFNNMGTKVIRDQEASCDEQGRYIFMNIKKGDNTRIEEYSENCYDIYVNDCEVLYGTERFILEALAELKSKER